jgi:hypothetical protein
MKNPLNKFQRKLLDEDCESGMTKREGESLRAIVAAVITRRVAAPASRPSRRCLRIILETLTVPRISKEATV